MEKLGRKFWLAILWGVALVAVLVVFLSFKVHEPTIICAWLAAFVAIPTQFSVANASITKAFAKTDQDDGK
jgi:hypothetical protein